LICLDKRPLSLRGTIRLRRIASMSLRIPASPPRSAVMSPRHAAYFPRNDALRPGNAALSPDNAALLPDNAAVRQRAATRLGVRIRVAVDIPGRQMIGRLGARCAAAEIYNLGTLGWTPAWRSPAN
jgi:hypothetical protein